MTVVNIHKELMIQFIMKYVNCISLWIYLVKVKPRAILLWIDCVFFFKISNEHLLQTSKREQGKLASNTPSLVILNDIVTFKLNEIKFCQAKMPSIKFFLVIQILFLFSGAIWNWLVVEKHASAGGRDCPLHLLYEPRFPASSRPWQRIGKWCIYVVSFIVATCTLVFPQYSFLGWLFI